MKADRLSLNLALLSQALFAVLLSFSSWNAAAYGALSLAAVALVLGSRRGFPRLPMGVFLCFASMAIASLLFKGEDFFPYTGLFFAFGLAAASLADALLPAIKERSLRSIHWHSFALGALYALSACLHVAFFPHLAYLYFGVGGLILVSVFDIVSGVFFSVRAARSQRAEKREAKPPLGLPLAAFVLFSLAANAPEAAAQIGPAGQERPAAHAGRTDEETFAALFGEEVVDESASLSPVDRLLISSIEVETPDCFTEAYLLSFARELKIGRWMTRSELERDLLKIRERMEFSHQFYQVSVSYLPIAEDLGGSGETEVAVTIKASEGFWWDFNYEPYDVSVGYKNLFRSGKELQAVAGLNTQSLHYRDPAIANGSFYYSASLAHQVVEDANLDGENYIYESVSGEGEAGIRFGDDLRLGFGAGYAVYKAASEYFLYSGYEAPDSGELERLGMAGELDDYQGIATLSLRSSLGAYSYQRRGGVHGRVEGSLAALLPRGAPSETDLKTTVSGDLRFDAALGNAARTDAARLLRLTIHERIEFFPGQLEGGSLSEPLWADIDEGRYLTGLVSGELASLSRASLGLDPLAVIDFGFTRLSLIPELYYEFTVVRMASYYEAPRWAQNVGFLIKGAFSAPVNRVFSLGLAFSLPSEAANEANAWEPKVALFLEIE